MSLYKYAPILILTLFGSGVYFVYGSNGGVGDDNDNNEILKLIAEQQSEILELHKHFAKLSTEQKANQGELIRKIDSLKKSNVASGKEVIKALNGNFVSLQDNSKNNSEKLYRAIRGPQQNYTTKLKNNESIYCWLKNNQTISLINNSALVGKVIVYPKTTAKIKIYKGNSTKPDNEPWGFNSQKDYARTTKNQAVIHRDELGRVQSQGMFKLTAHDGDVTILFGYSQ